MKKESSINIRVDKDIKNQVEEIFESMGLNISTAVNIFFTQCIRVDGIPFDIKAVERKNKEKRVIRICNEKVTCTKDDDILYFTYNDNNVALFVEKLSAKELCIYPNIWKYENRVTLPSVIHHEESFISDYNSIGFSKLKKIDDKYLKILAIKDLDKLTIHINGMNKCIINPEDSVNDIHIILYKDLDNYLKYCNDFVEYKKYKI